MTGAEQRPVPALPKRLVENPRLSRWVRVEPDDTVTVRIGKVELGQGILTALTQVAADELDVLLSQVRVQPARTAESPDEGLTAGSMSVIESGSAVRQVCAEVRALFVAAAAGALALDPATVTIRDGVIGDGAHSTTYGALANLVDLDRDADGSASPKTPADLRIVGTSVPRLDLPDKIAGRPRFIHDLVLPGQLHGRAIRPPSPAATLVDVDLAAVQGLPGVLEVVRDGTFLGVVAEDEEVAERAAQALAAAARWDEKDTLPDEDDLPTFLRTGPVDTTVVAETPPPTAAGPPTDASQPTTASQPTEAGPHTEARPPTDPAPPAEVRRLRASYSRPFLAHASIAPSCGLARWDGDQVEVWTHSQGIYNLRGAIAQALRIDAGRVRVQHVESAGSYGHNGADDAAFDAVLLARAIPGRPVRVRWSRRDELTWAPFGSAMAIDVEAGVDAAGSVVSWSHDAWSQGHTSRPGFEGSPALLAATHLARPHPQPLPADPPPVRGGGTGRNAAPIYAFPQQLVRAHRALRAPLRSSSLRGLGAFTNVFAIESFMDELALAAGRDPLEYRLAHLDDPRARDVLNAAATLGNWARRGEQDSVGYGIGFARYKGRGAYCAVVAEVEAVYEVRLRRLAVAVDVGLVVNPDGVRNQLEGGAVQSASWTLKERVRFDRRRVTSVDWETYPILRFSEVPRVEVEVLSRPDQPSVGAGEAAQGPTAAAIANAVADALSLRVRDLPITAERIVAAMEG